MNNKKVKRKLNIKALIFILLALYLALYLFIMLVYNVLTLPVKNIIITGNKVLSYEEIINVADIKDTSSLIRTNSKKISQKIKELPLVKDVEVKKKLNGQLDINITEEKILYYNRSDAKYVISGNKEVTLENIVGIPSLVNYTPKEICANLNKRLSEIDDDIITLISEIEYSPDVKNDITVDENRFILRMNDGNRVFINIANFGKLNSYKKLYSTINENEKGTFYLDGNQNRILFRTYEAEAQGEKIEDVGDVNELPN